MRCHICYISSNLPRPGTGSSVILYRHLQKFLDWKITIIATDCRDSNELPKQWKILPLPPAQWWWPPLRRTFWRFWGLRQRILALAVQKLLQNDIPSVVLNQFGKNSVFAWQIAKLCQIPLGLVIHDPWDTWVSCGIEAMYMRAYGASQILSDAQWFWPVSHELANYYKLLPTKTRVLPPIPYGWKYPYASWKSSFAHPVIAFAGSYHDHDVPFLAKVAQALHAFQGTLLLILPQSQALENLKSEYHNIQQYVPFIKNDEAIAFIQQAASAFLVLNVFDPQIPQTAHWRFNFPSKFVEFVHTGLPMLVIAHPQTAISQWCLAHQWQTYGPDFENTNLTCLIQKIVHPETWTSAALQSRSAAQNEFNPDQIQAILENDLIALASRQ